MINKILFLTVCLSSLIQAVPRVVNTESQRLPKRSQESRTPAQNVVTTVKRLVKAPLSGVEVGLNKCEVRKGRVSIWKMQKRKLLKAAGVHINLSNMQGLSILYNKKKYSDGRMSCLCIDIGYDSDNE